MFRRYFRPQVLAGHVLVLAAALTCLRLGWWQWDVFGEARGTGQNLGYALLWPVFAGSFIYMWLRFLQLESIRDPDADPRAADAADAPVDGGDAVAGGGPPAGIAVMYDDVRGVSPHAGRGTPGQDVPSTGKRHTQWDGHEREAFTVGMGYVGTDDDDPELAAYNRALARLAEEDERRAR